MNTSTLTIEEVKNNLCYYDPENPNNNLDCFDGEDVIVPREKDCYCDNCFYGRDKLALYILSNADVDAPENKKYTVDCFTPQSEGGRFPDNSYSVDTVEEVGEILANVSRPAAGISKVEIFILENAEVRHGAKDADLD